MKLKVLSMISRKTCPRSEIVFKVAVINPRVNKLGSGEVGLVTKIPKGVFRKRKRDRSPPVLVFSLSSFRDKEVERPFSLYTMQ
jgi:hypothetical protein